MKPVRLLAEILLIVAVAEIAIMMVLPILIPNASVLSQALVSMAMLLSLCAPVIYWRFLLVFRGAAGHLGHRHEVARGARRAVALTALAQISGLLLTAGGVWWQAGKLDEQSLTQFMRAAERTENEVIRRLNQSVYGLKGARGAMAAHPNFGRREFRAYVTSRNLAAEFPGIRGFGFIERVQRTDLSSFSARERADGAPDFSVRTSGSAPDLLVIKYVEPLAENRPAMGFDVGQESVRRQAAERAIDTGEPTLSGQIELVQDEKRTPGFLYFVPVYKKGAHPQSAQERRRDLAGLLYAPIVAAELFDGATSVTDHLVDFGLYGRSAISADQLIYDSAHVAVASIVPEREYRAAHVVQVGNQALTLRSYGSPRFAASQDRSSLTFIGLGGIVLSLLVALTVWLLAVGRERAQVLAAAMTTELERMAQVVQHTGSAVTIMDRKMRIVWVNQGFTQITGHSFDDALGKTPGELLSSGKSDPAALEVLRDSAERAVPCRVELINLSKDGREYWADVELQPTFDQDKNLVGFMEIGTDITLGKQTQHQLEAAMRETNALLATLRVHAIVSETDRAGKIISVNESFCQISGYSREELIGQSHSVVNSGVQPPAFWADCWQTIRGGKPWRGEICNRAKDGSLYWVDSMIAPFVGDKGEIEKYVSIRTDITARKRAEEALSVSNALMEETQRIAQVGGWELDLKSGALFWTRETYRIHETSPDEFKPNIEASVGFFSPDSRERIMQAMQGTIERGEGYDLELETHTTKGRLIHVRTTGTATLVQGTTVRVSGIFQDITQRKQYERSLLEAREVAELATQSKGQFLANMSHEIRTPMNAILGMLKLLGNTVLSNNQFDYVRKTEGAANSLLALINDILDFSKIDAGKMELDQRPFHVERLMRDLAVVLAANVGAKNIEVLYDLDPNLPERLTGDAMRLQQVLINLAGNAVKFTSSGQVVISLKLAQASPQVARIAFAVKDSGIGIAPENQSRIFSGFSQAEASTSRRFGGTGLGLAISQRLVEMMGGQIELASQLGVGSTFSFQLSLSVASEPLQKPALPVEAEAVQRVLVVDDNRVSCELMVKMMRPFGWELVVAHSGPEALDRTRAQARDGVFPFQCVFVDWQMPGMDGWETVRRLEELGQTLGGPPPRFILLSANSRDDVSQRTPLEQDRLNAFLVKPVTASMLLEASSSLPRGREAARGVQRSSRRQLAGMRVLVVEDNAMNQQVAEELLSFEGALVSIAADGRQGVNAVASARPQFDAVLMDIQMPVMDGYAATQVLRDKMGLRQLPIIGLTANAMASDRDACLRAGMNEHMGKPFDMGQLVAMLLRLTGFQPDPDKGQSDATPFWSLPPGQAAQALDAVVPDGLGPDVQELDLPAALGRMGGMKPLYVRAALVLQKTLASFESDLHAQVQSGGWATAVMLLHTVKGNAGTLGLVRLAGELASLEKFSQTQPTPAQGEARLVSLAMALDAAQPALVQAIAMLDADLAHASPAVPVMGADLAASQCMVARLIPLLEASDLSVLGLFAEARSDLAALPEAQLDQLEAALQNLDLEDALAVCRAIMAA